jgi:tetratricopeptide (TPR) repeat protein
MVFTILVAGCSQSAIEEMRRQLESQQAILEKNQREIEQLRAAQAATPRIAAVTPGTCDTSVMELATRKGGERFAANDLEQALGYYEDALAACPQSAKTEVNVARTYEALGNRSLAILHYQHAAGDDDAADADARAQARAALARIGSR